MQSEKALNHIYVDLLSENFEIVNIYLCTKGITKMFMP